MVFSRRLYILNNDSFSMIADIVVTELRGGGDGYCLWPVFVDGNGARKEAVLYVAHGVLTLSRGPWRLIDGKDSGSFTRSVTLASEPLRQLYDLDVDLGETMALHENRPEIASALMTVLDSLRSQISL